MKTPFTYLRFAPLLLTLCLSTLTLQAQTTSLRRVSAKQPAPGSKSMGTSAAAVQKPATRPVGSKQATPAPQPAATTLSTRPENPAAASSQTRTVVTGSSEPATARPLPIKQTDATSNSPLDGGRNKYLNVGVGLAAYYGGGLPLGASFEMDVKDNISVGGSIDYMRYGYNSGGYKWNYTFIYAGARASYHLADILNVDNNTFDPYVGATLGLRYAGYTDNYGYDNYVSPYNSGLYLGIHIGARYLFSEKLGGFAEVGYGVSALRLGLTAKF